jgi:hypothetical protein
VTFEFDEQQKAERYMPSLPNIISKMPRVLYKLINRMLFILS